MTYQIKPRISFMRTKEVPTVEVVNKIAAIIAIPVGLITALFFYP